MLLAPVRTSGDFMIKPLPIFVKFEQAHPVHTYRKSKCFFHHSMWPYIILFGVQSMGYVWDDLCTKFGITVEADCGRSI